MMPENNDTQHAQYTQGFLDQPLRSHIERSIFESQRRLERENAELERMLNRHPSRQYPGTTPLNNWERRAERAARQSDSSAVAGFRRDMRENTDARNRLRKWKIIAAVVGTLLISTRLWDWHEHGYYERAWNAFRRTYAVSTFFPPNEQYKKLGTVNEFFNESDGKYLLVADGSEGRATLWENTDDGVKERYACGVDIVLKKAPAHYLSTTGLYALDSIVTTKGMFFDDHIIFHSCPNRIEIAQGISECNTHIGIKSGDVSDISSIIGDDKDSTYIAICNDQNNLFTLINEYRNATGRHVSFPSLMQ